MNIIPLKLNKKLDVAEGVITNSIIRFLNKSHYPKNILITQLRNKEKELKSKISSNKSKLNNIESTKTVLVSEIEEINKINRNLIKELKESI
jgi:hypothetical protein